MEGPTLPVFDEAEFFQNIADTTKHMAMESNKRISEYFDPPDVWSPPQQDMNFSNDEQVLLDPPEQHVHIENLPLQHAERDDEFDAFCEPVWQPPVRPEPEPLEWQPRQLQAVKLAPQSFYNRYFGLGSNSAPVLCHRDDEAVVRHVATPPSSFKFRRLPPRY